MAHEIWAVAQLGPGEGIVDGVDRIHTILSTRPPAPEDAGTVERALQGLADIFEHFKDRKQAPDHGHDVPGIWDNYNGDKSGKPCDWCAKWNAARSALAALSRLDGEA